MISVLFLSATAFAHRTPTGSKKNIKPAYRCSPICNNKVTYQSTKSLSTLKYMSTRESTHIQKKYFKSQN